MNDTLIWLHGDCLNPHNPALQSHPDCPRVFVFDEALLAAYKISLKRIAFLYECLLEIPGIQIRKGDVTAELLAAMQENNVTRLLTVASIAPRFMQIVSALQLENIDLTILPAPAFVTSSSPLDLKRFSRYWQQVKRQALSLNESLF